MTNAALLSIFNYLCNEARNSAHAIFGLLDADHLPSADSSRRSCLAGTRAGTDRMLQTIDDVRELLLSDPVPVTTLEDFDAALCLGETLYVLNFAGGGASRIVHDAQNAPLVIRQDRRAVEQIFTRILGTGLKLTRQGDVRVSSFDDPPQSGALFEIAFPDCEVGPQIHGWLNTGLDSVSFQTTGEVMNIVALMVAGRRLRALGGKSECFDKPGSSGLSLHIPSQSQGLVGTTDPRLNWRPEALNVLIAEDNDESAALTALLLSRENLWRACNGKQAVDLMKVRRFDIVFMDANMPDLDGYTAMRTFRDWETQNAQARTPIVMLSSDDLETQFRYAAASGCSGFLRKPLRKSDLLDLMDRLKDNRVLAGEVAV